MQSDEGSTRNIWLAVNSILEAAWNVSKEIKPLAHVQVFHSKSADSAVSLLQEFVVQINSQYNDIKLIVDDDGMSVYAYKYEHVFELYKYAQKNFLGKDDRLYHAISGYLYGIPAREVQNFLDKL